MGPNEALKKARAAAKRWGDAYSAQGADLRDADALADAFEALDEYARKGLLPDEWRDAFLKTLKFTIGVAGGGGGPRP